MKTKIAEPTSRPEAGRKLHGQLSPFSPQFAADSAVNLGPSLNGFSRISIRVFLYRPMDDHGEGQCSLRRTDACSMRELVGS